MKKIVSIILVAVLALGLFAGCQDTTPPDNSPDLAGTYDVTLWVSELAPEGKISVVDLTKEQIKAFEAANPGIKINASIEGVTEADAASKVVADVASAPDIYCFAQDQLARLVQAAALAAPGKTAAASLRELNDATSIAAASVAGELYAYPMTSDNGYYLYYDKSIFTEEDVESLETLIAKCEQSGKKFRYALENAWYTASFFFATGCHSNWIMNQDGEYINIDDTFNSAEGIIAYKGMQLLTSSSCYDSNADIFTDAAVVVTGIWNAPAAEAHFGENLGATDLPSFTIDGKTYHLGSYAGTKLMGVKPQTDAKKAAVLSMLAQFLTNEQSQLERYEHFQWGPSNVVAQNNDAVKTNVSLIALRKQNEFSITQGQIHGSWWDIAKLLGADAKANKDPQTSLNEYSDAINKVLNMTDDQKNAWGVIGNICNTNWDTDFAMTEEPAGTFTSDVLTLKAGEQFKVRQGASWDVNYGANGVAGGDNIVVEADGNYRVQLVINGDSVSVTLIPA